MKTNVDLNAALVAEAMRVSGRRTKKETVTEALREYIARRKAQVSHLFGNIEFDPDHADERPRRTR